MRRIRTRFSAAKAGAALDQIVEIDLSGLKIPGPEEVKVTQASLGHDPNEAAPFEVWRNDELVEQEGTEASGEHRDPWHSVFW
ncbi:MAG TPA: hypothetical protein VMA86_06570 [Acetobacteraceae bacterium]|nr:hypothetical protein [Acetobacteraceae bacterium]